MDPIVETRGLARRFQSVEALRGLDLVLPPGGLFALLGCNGAGKTTAIKLIAGLMDPTGGSSCVFGMPSLRLGPAQWQKMAYVSENQELYDRMTIEELLEFLRPLYATWDMDLERKLREMLALPKERRIGHCSRGERAKVAMLTSLPYRPRLVILDEPLAGLDPLARDELLGALLEITEQDEWTVLFSTQDVDDVERLADRVGFLDRGRLRLDESLHDLQARFRVVDATLASADPVSFPDRDVSGVAQRGTRLSLVHERFSADAERELRLRLHGAQIEARPMSLREIFVALARRYREENGHV